MARKTVKHETPSPEGLSLAELLQDDSDNVLPSFGDTNGLAGRRLLHAVGELGGMVTYFVDHTNSRLCFSVRIGSDKRSYNAETAEELDRLMEQFVGKLIPALNRLKKPPPPLK